MAKAKPQSTPGTLTACANFIYKFVNGQPPQHISEGPILFSLCFGNSLGPVLFSSQGKLLVEVRFLMRQDPCKNHLKYKKVFPQESVPSEGRKWLAMKP
jgi:hypothetical protein